MKRTVIIAGLFALLVTTMVFAAPASPYFDGNGGEGMSLAILIPEGKNLAAAEAYLPTLVQGVFVSDLSKYSAMSVLDRQNLERVLKETESGYYKNEADYIQVGQTANVGYALIGSLTKTASGFTLQIQIADTANGLAKASYTGSCTARELDNFTGIKKASLDLLTQMGVQLTAKGREELTGAGAQEAVNVETALARGITAQKNGTMVEALNYYYNAASYGAGAPEVNSRLAALQTSVKTGNFREDARNDIQQRKAWLAILKECEDFFKVESRKYPAEIVYDPAYYPVSEINFQNETQSFAARVELRPTRDAQNMLRVVQNVRDGLNALGKNKLKAWSGGNDYLTYWPCYSFDDKTGDFTKPMPSFFANSEIYYYRNVIGVEASLINEKGKVIGTDLIFLGYVVGVPSVDEGISMTFFGQGAPGENRTNSMDMAAAASFWFGNVKINDITDRVTLKITRVFTNNGSEDMDSVILQGLKNNVDRCKIIDAETAGKIGLIRISAGTVRNPSKSGSYQRTITAERDDEWVDGKRVLSAAERAAAAAKAKADAELKAELSRLGFESFSGGEIGRYIGREKSVIIPSAINGVPVTSIGANACWQKNLTSVTIPDGVTSIGTQAFGYNELNSIFIPNSVTYIGTSAFNYNQLYRITIGSNVKLEKDAFDGTRGIYFAEFYDSLGKRAGTYEFRNDKRWEYVGAYSDKKDYDRAIADYTQALKLDPNNALIYYGRGKCYGEKGDPDRGIADLNQSIKLNPNSADAYGVRGVLYFMKGKKSLAIKDLEKALRLDPSNEGIKDALKQVRGR